ncbi:MAG: hypothetical protein EOO74_10605, partial [Myxococcales bacterium]
MRWTQRSGAAGLAGAGRSSGHSERTAGSRFARFSAGASHEERSTRRHHPSPGPRHRGHRGGRAGRAPGGRAGRVDGERGRERGGRADRGGERASAGRVRAARPPGA